MVYKNRRDDPNGYPGVTVMSSLSIVQELKAGAGYQLAASSTAASIWPFFCQALSKCGDLAGMRMYSTSEGTIASSQNWLIFMARSFIHRWHIARMDQCETRARELEPLTTPKQNEPMPLYRATALIAMVLIVLLSAGYAASERVESEQEFSQAAFDFPS